MIDAYSLRLFVAVADHLHFGRAARAVGLSQSPLSQRIRRLEEEIGGELFERDNRNVALSPLGTQLQGEAEALVRRLQAFEERAKALAEGKVAQLSLAYVGPALGPLVAPALATLRATHPALRVRVRRMGTEAQLQAVSRGDVQFGVVRLFGHALGPLTAKRLWRERYVLAVADDDPLAKRKRLRAANLQSRQVLAFNRGQQPRLHDAIAHRFQEMGAALLAELEVTTKEEAVALVRAGVGPAIVPASTPLLPGVVAVSLPGGFPPVELSLIEREQSTPGREALVHALQDAAQQVRSVTNR